MKLRLIEGNGEQVAVSAARDDAYGDSFMGLNQDGDRIHVKEQDVRDALAREYLERIGYDPFDDDPNMTTEEVWKILDEHDEEFLASCIDEDEEGPDADFGCGGPA